jgi:hypothetical protein
MHMLLLVRIFPRGPNILPGGHPPPPSPGNVTGNVKKQYEKSYQRCDGMGACVKRILHKI